MTAEPAPPRPPGSGARASGREAVFELHPNAPYRLDLTCWALRRRRKNRVDLTPFYRMAEDHLRLRDLRDRFLGVRPPRFPTLFESLVNAVANQQLSLEVGIELLNRLRGAGRIDVFPGDDVGARNKLQRLMELDHPPGYEEIGEIVAPWDPAAGMVYFHLLLDGLDRKGELDAVA